MRRPVLFQSHDPRDAAAGRARERYSRGAAPIAANLPGNDFRTLQQIVDESVSPRRFLVLCSAPFAAFTLVLASLGIYGLISYSSVSARRNSASHRARRLRARRTDARHRAALWLAAIGMVLGTVTSWAIVRSAGSLLLA